MALCGPLHQLLGASFIVGARSESLLIPDLPIMRPPIINTPMCTFILLDN